METVFFSLSVCLCVGVFVALLVKTVRRNLALCHPQRTRTRVAVALLGVEYWAAFGLQWPRRFAGLSLLADPLFLTLLATRRVPSTMATESPPRADSSLRRIGR